MRSKLSNYDMEMLEEASRLLIKVYEYNYGNPRLKRLINRLATIIEKLETLKHI